VTKNELVEELAEVVCDTIGDRLYHDSDLPDDLRATNYGVNSDGKSLDITLADGRIVTITVSVGE
jgi:hypothetical protein